MREKIFTVLFFLLTVFFFSSNQIFGQDNNLCSNSSFEKNIKYWKNKSNYPPILFERSSRYFTDGNYSAHIVTNKFKSGVRTNSFLIVKDKQYLIRFKIFVVTGRVIVTDNSNRLGDFQRIIIGHKQWEQIEITSKATITQNEIINFSQHNSTHAEWYIDEVQIFELNNTKLPTITQQPKDQFVMEGTSAVFSVKVKGQNPFHFRWQVNNRDIYGNDSPYFVIKSTKLSQSGNAYRCIVTNSFGADTTNFAFLYINNKNGVNENQKWETVLISKAKYKNPYKDVILKVHYYNSDSTINYYSYGFWDGDSIFKLRTYFSKAGIWFWETTCSNKNDSGLNNKKGKLTVSKYNGKIKLYKHGALKVSENHRYLTYEDGTPFLWMGGTAWQLPVAASFDEWKNYIDDRASKNFNIVQIAPARRFNKNSTRFPKNKKGDVSFFADDKWNPAYWQEFDRFIEYANSKDIVVVIIGLAEPVYEIPSLDNARLFARNISARTDGYHVILAPAFDVYQNEWFYHYDNVGNYIKASHNLITQHPGTPVSGSQNSFAAHFHNESYLDFALNQTGHNGGNVDKCYKRARLWNIELWNDKPTKPFINAEAYYSSGKYAGKFSSNVYNGTDKNARALGWLSWLSGSMGYTYGATGIWNYGQKTNNEITIPLKEAMKYKSSTQMKYMVDFLAAIHWWELIPIHSAIHSDIKNQTKKMALAIARNGKFGVAYLPDNKFITIDMSKFSVKTDATWFNPITAVYTKSEEIINHKNEHTFYAPRKGEWVLLIKEADELRKKSHQLTKNSLYNFKLQQNYPNPFNPTTTIRYTIPKTSSDFGLRDVQLEIYDILGKKVATLVNEKKPAGNYQTTFDGSNLPSGIYFYSLTSGKFRKTKKLILLK